MKFNKKTTILAIIAAVIVVSTLNAFLISGTSVTGSSIANLSGNEFPGMSVVIIVAVALGSFFIIKQHHESK